MSAEREGARRDEKGREEASSGREREAGKARRLRLAIFKRNQSCPLLSSFLLSSTANFTMGAYKYVAELYKKKYVPPPSYLSFKIFW